MCKVGGEDAALHGPLTANVGESRDMIDKMGGTCAVATRPRICSVVACTWNAAVWLCNDNAVSIAPSCSFLASCVADFVGMCGLGTTMGVGTAGVKNLIRMIIVLSLVGAVSGKF
ncbi:hypothetical protein F4824DRAFT_464694 [Ustulina deusta]|nr:hypothetical protein F4824DRAFT_464694 [Ustulina deusta]